MTQNSSNQKFTNNSDGFDIAGGTTPRKLTVSGGDVSVAGSGSAVITFPNATSTLATLAGSEALTNKTINGLTPTAVANGFTIAGGTTSKTLTVPLDASVSGTNTGDQSLTGLVPYTGATGAVTLGANTLSTTSGVISPKVYPASDSTTAFVVTKADGATNILVTDTTNSRVGVGATPLRKFHVANTATASNDANTLLIQNLNANTNAWADIDFTCSTSTTSPTILGRIRLIRTNAVGAGDTDLTFQTFNSSALSEKMRLDSLGRLGIGVTPTAFIHLKAGSATASTAPLKFTSGTDLTTAEAGAMEYDGTNLHFTAVGTLRENIHFGSKGSGTLTAGTTTTITDANAKTTSTIVLQATSAAYIALSPYISAKNNGTFVITTLAAAGTETFDYLITN